MEEPITSTDNEARAWLAAIVDSSLDAIIGKTLDGIITSWNHGAELVYGYAADEVIGRPISILQPPGTRDDVSIILHCIKRGKRLYHYRTNRLTKDGRIIPVSLAVSPIKDAEGRVIGAATIARDITSIALAEEAVKGRERFTRLVLDALSTHLAILDQNGVIHYTNRAWGEFAEQNECSVQSSWVGMNYLHVCDSAKGPEESVARAAGSGIRAVIDGTEPELSLEYSCHSPTQERWFHMRATRFVDGDSVWIVVAHEDITERTMAREELRRSEDKFARAFQSSPGILVISELETGRYIDVNDNFVRVLGFSREEAVGRTSVELGIWADVSERRRIVNALKAGETIRNTDVYLRKRSGQVFPTLLSADVIKIGDRDCLLAIVTDMTERKVAEEEREEARKALEEVYDRERRIAETLQRNFLPDTSLQIEGYLTADVCLPALDEAAIGGDVYDVFRLPDDRIALLVADVSGKGLKAVRYGAMMKYMLRAYAYRSNDPAEVLGKLNAAAIIDMDIETFITCFFGILDRRSGVFRYANAGHEEPLHVSRAGEIGKLPATGPALGFIPDADYSSGVIHLEPGDIVFVYTDGVTDARGVEEAMGVDGLIRHMESHCSISAKSLVDCILTEVRRRSGDMLRDDVAMLALEALR